ncbi:uncharacterized protein LOC5576923 [Aedes aegypti]|uniref:Uncharacterized protein n=1 Tax=Aedes aegypti TaxID=7159 RepID=A0A1S4FXE6_AEDAE|nr:uncharacterized protein LOC5576923 [Aedes aegypti]
MGWQRPSEPAIPTVWYTFQAPDPDNDEQLVTYRVEDLTEDRFDDIIEHYKEYFVVDEPIYASRKTNEDETAMKELEGFWRWCLEQRLTIVCYKEGSNEIVGANLLHMEQSDDKGNWDIFQSKTIQDVVKTHLYMTEQFDVFQRYNVDRYLTAYGLALNHRYRGRGIATEILKARVPICRAFDVRLSATNFTAVASQKAAEKAGFRNDFEVTYNDFANMGPEYLFEESLKLMSLIIE